MKWLVVAREKHLIGKKGNSEDIIRSRLFCEKHQVITYLLT